MRLEKLAGTSMCCLVGHDEEFDSLLRETTDHNGISGGTCPVQIGSLEQALGPQSGR